MGHRLALSIELGTAQTGTGKVDTAMKFKCTTAARACYITLSILCFTKIRKEENTKVIKSERKEKMKEKKT